MKGTLDVEFYHKSFACSANYYLPLETERWSNVDVGTSQARAI